MKPIRISDTCQLEIEDEDAEQIGWKYAIGDGGSGGASTFATLTTDAEFNRLAMEAPLVNQMRGLIGMVELGGDDRTEAFLRAEAKKILADIAELEMS